MTTSSVTGRNTTGRYQAIKGMPDILPKDSPLWQRFESCWRQLMWNYGYQEIRFPLVEATGLFKRSIGEVTDIVEKEMFTFTDKDDESITLRPEGTAGCVRAGIENGLLYHQIQRLWYMGPMFRYEKPQKGRYRQFHHAGIEAFGLQGPDIEVEHILLTQRLWQTLGIDGAISLQINSIGSEASRKTYRQTLVEYLSRHRDTLDEDSLRRLDTNPMRILDSKNPAMADLIQNAPRSYDYLTPEDRTHFDEFQRKLKDLGIRYQVNPCIVRGLDYYNRTVYEWTTDQLGAQGAVGAGGRYDALVDQLGGEPTFGVGFAIGIERVILLLEKMKGSEDLASGRGAPDIYMIAVGEQAEHQIMHGSEQLRSLCPTLSIVVNCGGGSFKTQFKRADKSGAKIALILGDEELKKKVYGIKYLREQKDQLEISFDKMSEFLKQEVDLPL